MLSKVEILRSAPDENAQAWKTALQRLDLGEPIKHESAPKRVSAVFRASVLGSQVAIKLDAPRGLKRLLCTLGLDQTHARRQWSGASVLRAAEIDAAEGFVLARCLWNDRGTPRWAELVAVEWLEGRTLLEAIASATRPERPAIARAAGRLTARLTGSMILNRDHKPSNLIVRTPEGNTDPQLAMIDTVGIRTGVLADRASVRMLRDLLLEPTGVGHPPTTRDIARFLQGLREGGFWTGPPRVVRAFKRQLIASVREAIQAHGDPTPKVNPLQD